MSGGTRKARALGRLSLTKTGFGVEPTGTLHNVLNEFAARGEHRLP